MRTIDDLELSPPFTEHYSKGKVMKINHRPHAVALYAEGKGHPLIITYDRYQRSAAAGKILTLAQYDAMLMEKATNMYNYNKGKYIVGAMATDLGIVDVAIVFPEHVTHVSVARHMFIPDTIRSAGFFHVEEGSDGKMQVVAYGHSGSLNKESQPLTDVIYLRQSLEMVEP